MKLHRKFEKIIDENKLIMIRYRDNNSYIRIKVMDNCNADSYIKKTMKFIENIRMTFNPNDIKYNHSYHPLASVFKTEIKIWW